MECTFYDSTLKTPDLYIETIEEFFEGDEKDTIIRYKCFKKVKVDKYFSLLHHGQTNKGRIIYMEEDKDD